MYIVAFLNTNDDLFMEWTLGPFDTEVAAEQARLAFIEEMDSVDDFSAVYVGDVLELLPPREVARRMARKMITENPDRD